MNELLARSQAKKQKLTKDELLDASDQVKANLVTVLKKLTLKLASESPDAISPAVFARLVDAASKLFAWPASKSIDMAADFLKNQLPTTTAINLALIRTTPEQLRAKARQRTINVEEEQARLAS